MLSALEGAVSIMCSRGRGRRHWHGGLRAYPAIAPDHSAHSSHRARTVPITECLGDKAGQR
jgi:hypothetical protein